MRSVISIILGFSILILGSLFTINKINNSSEIITNYLTETEDYIKNDNWDSALLTIKSTQKYWEQAENWWAIILDHDAIHNIEICIKKLEKYIETKNLSLTLGEMETLKILIKDLPDSETLTIHNIL
ncbi:MAG: DUF4363 family protein [Eubacteriales bacterium]